MFAHTVQTVLYDAFAIKMTNMMSQSFNATNATIGFIKVVLDSHLAQIHKDFYVKNADLLRIIYRNHFFLKIHFA